MLIDSFLFNNEFEIAEARLRYLDDIVDYFVIAEASISHSGQQKPLYWKERNFLAEEFGHKIIYVTLNQNDFEKQKETVFGIPTDAISNIIGTSRKRIGEEVKKRFDNAFLIYSDLDEIPRKESISAKKNSLTLLEHSLQYYFIDCCCYTVPFMRLPWSLVIETDILKDINLNSLRNKTFEAQANYLQLLNSENMNDDVKYHKSLERQITDNLKIDVELVPDAGWHLSYMGGIDKVIDKIRSSGHVEIFDDFDCDKEKLLKKVNSGEDFLGRDIHFRFEEPEKLFPQELLKHFPAEFLSNSVR